MVVSVWCVSNRCKVICYEGALLLQGELLAGLCHEVANRSCLHRTSHHWDAAAIRRQLVEQLVLASTANYVQLLYGSAGQLLEVNNRRCISIS